MCEPQWTGPLGSTRSAVTVFPALGVELGSRNATVIVFSHTFPSNYLGYLVICVLTI